MTADSMVLTVGPHLGIDLDAERWRCGRCAHDLGPAADNVKRGCLVNERDPHEVHRPLIDTTYNFAPHPDWVRILEFCCPGCGSQIETEYLPPGHPITNTTEIDVASLKARLAAGEIAIEDGRVTVVEAASGDGQAERS